MSKLSAAILASFSANRRRAYLVGPQDCTFAQLEADVAALAQFFALNQLDGKRVIVATQQDRALLTCFCAALLAGATAAILDPKAPTPELSALVNAADAGGMIADAEVLDRLASADGLRQVPVQIPVNRPAPARGSFRVFGDRKSAAEANDFAGVLAQHVGAKLQATDVDDEAIAYILFTSGTTSRPKGVTISHRALFAQMQTFIRNYGLDDRSRVMNLLPFHHTDGLTQGAMMCLLAGSTFVRPYAFTADILPQMLNDLYKHAVTHLVTVPSVLALTRTLESSFDGAFDYPEFRFVVSTAAFLEPSLWQSCEERFGIQVVNVYGLTETVCETLYSGPAPEHRRLGSVGKPIDSRAKIVDDEGRELGDGQIGELLVAGDHLMSGYFNNPEATEEVLQDGWFRTGDLARRDKDGFYFITGRKKDLIISGGMNIYPEDVNGVLRSIPGVIDAATFGLPDPMWGERAVSCVVCDEGADPSEEELVAQFLERASRQKLPREIVRLESFPRGPAGKFIMSELTRLYATRAGRDQPEGGDSEADVSARLYSIAAQVLRCSPDHWSPPSEPDTVPGWTSLSHVEMMLAIEEGFGFKLSSRDIMRFRSLGDAMEIVRNRIAA
jgi:long-chain acyl-CoA synthetase